MLREMDGSLGGLAALYLHVVRVSVFLFGGLEWDFERCLQMHHTAVEFNGCRFGRMNDRRMEGK